MLHRRPTAIKIDPYLNVDAGTMSPFEHGEVFVLDDGGETDLDLGNYERFLDVSLTSDSNLTTGKVYQAVISKERKGDYLGKTVQIIPHITNEIIDRIFHVAREPVDGSGEEPDVVVIELGGTIGDIESMPFVEALRQLQLQVGIENMCFLHVSMVPTVGEDKEQKTKPTQHSVKELRSLGIQPDFIVCRSGQPLLAGSREKIALFCNVSPERVLSIYDVRNIYHVPSVMIEQDFPRLLSDRLGLNKQQQEESSVVVGLDQQLATQWRDMAHTMDTATEVAHIAIIGKYTNLGDAYLSIVSALKHGAIATKQQLKVTMLESSHLEEEQATHNPKLYEEAWEKLREADGILVPGGFGGRGIEGKIAAIRHARENKIPFLGICLGMQVAVIEYCRNVLGIPQANSEEFGEVKGRAAAVIFMPEGDKEKMGGTMRLGSRHTRLHPSSRAFQLYGGEKDIIPERHRHRYEVNPALVEELEERGLVFSGKDADGQQRMEIVELSPQIDHPYFIGVQFHPEFKSRPQRPAPVFLGLLHAVQKRRREC
eukprot:gene8431-9294_t